MQAEHPVNQASVVDDHTKTAIADILSSGIEGWTKSAKKAMSHWLGVSKKNEGQEADLHDRLHKVTPQVAQVVKTKNLVAFKRMLQHIEYPDVRAAELMVEGFP